MSSFVMKGSNNESIVSEKSTGNFVPKLRRNQSVLPNIGLFIINNDKKSLNIPNFQDLRKRTEKKKFLTTNNPNLSAISTQELKESKQRNISMIDLKQKIKKYKFLKCSIKEEEIQLKSKTNHLEINEEVIGTYLEVLFQWNEMETLLSNVFLFNKYNVNSQFNKIILDLKKSENYLNPFHNKNIVNEYFYSLYKYIILIVSVLKICISEYEFEGEVKNSLKQIVFEFSSLLYASFELFVFTLYNKNKLIIIIKQEQIERILKRQKSNFFQPIKKLFNINQIELLMQSLNNKLNEIKNCINESINMTFNKEQSPLNSTFSQLINSIEQIQLKDFSRIISDVILFDIMSRKNIKYIKQNNLGELEKNFILPPRPFKSQLKYTLVLDLDETLIHHFYTNQGDSFLLRPYVKEFLAETSKYFEIVVFTAGVQEYADKILNIIDFERKLIHHRLYRNHTDIYQNKLLKNLSKLGRDLDRVIIIDNIQGNYQLNHCNGLHSITWNGDIFDKQMLTFLKILRFIYSHKLSVLNFILQLNKMVKKTTEDIDKYCEIDLESLF